MHKLSELKEKLFSELEDYAENGKFSPDDVKNIKGLSSSIDHICNIADEYDDEGYSSRYYPMYGSYEGRGSYRDGSYARGRNARRDSMGRYSREGGYSRDGLADKLRELMAEAPDERSRQEIQRLIDKMEK